MILVEVTQPPGHFTTWLDLLDHWQSLVAGSVALIAALIAVLVPERFARRKEQREIDALRTLLAGEIRLYLDLLISTRRLLTTRKEDFRKGLVPSQRFGGGAASRRLPSGRRQVGSFGATTRRQSGRFLRYH